MADLKVDFCGVPFKNPVVIASLETTNSPDLMKQAFDFGASGAIITMSAPASRHMLARSTPS